MLLDKARMLTATACRIKRPHSDQTTSPPLIRSIDLGAGTHVLEIKSRLFTSTPQGHSQVVVGHDVQRLKTRNGWIVARELERLDAQCVVGLGLTFIKRWPSRLLGIVISAHRHRDKKERHLVRVCF